MTKNPAPRRQRPFSRSDLMRDRADRKHREKDRAHQVDASTERITKWDALRGTRDKHHG